QAIQKAIQELEQAKPKVDQGRRADLNRDLTQQEKKDVARALEEAKDQLSQTSKELSEAAQKQLDSVFRQVAQKAKNVAENQIKNAAEEAAKGELNADAAPERA